MSVALATSDSAAEKALTEALVSLLLEARSIADDFDALVVSGRRGTRQKVAVRVYAIGAVAVARELAAGVAREVAAEAPANGMRLARHLFEQDLDLHYLVEHPAAATRQFEAREAKSRLDLDKRVKELTLPPAWRKVLKAMRAEAYRRDDLARRANEAGEVVAATDRGLPTYEHKASALDRQEDYDFYYTGASWFSHPGVKASENQLLVNDALGTVRIRPTGSDPVLIDMALTLGVKSLVGVAGRANWCLGPIGGLDGRLESLLARMIPAAS